MSRASLYEQLGGEPVVGDVVARFYALLADDAEVRHLFDPARAAHVMTRQREYFAAMLGGPTGRFGADLAAELAAAHRTVPIEDHHVTRVIEHLREALRASGVPTAIAERVVAVANRLWCARRWN